MTWLPPVGSVLEDLLVALLVTIAALAGAVLAAQLLPVVEADGDLARLVDDAPSEPVIVSGPPVWVE